MIPLSVYSLRSPSENEFTKHWIMDILSVDTFILYSHYYGKDLTFEAQ